MTENKEEKFATGSSRTAERVAGENKHMERCDATGHSSQPTCLLKSFWPPADKISWRKHTSDLSLSISLLQ